MPKLDSDNVLNIVLSKVNNLLQILIRHTNAIILTKEIDPEALTHMNSLLLEGIRNSYNLILRNLSNKDPRKQYILAEKRVVVRIYEIVNNYRPEKNEELSTYVRELENLISNRNVVSHRTVVSKTVDAIMRKTLTRSDA